MHPLNNSDSKEHIPSNILAGSCLIIISAFIWCTYGMAILRKLIIINTMVSDYVTELMFCTFSFTGTVLSIFTGTLLVSRFISRRSLLLNWAAIGILSSTALPFLLLPTTEGSIFALAFLISFSFGFGLPSALAQFAETTSKANRAKMGAIVTVFMILGNIIAYIMITDNLMLNTLILIIWRSLGLAGVIPLWSLGKKEQNIGSAIAYSNRNVFNYFISWLIFSSINFFGLSMSYQIYGYDFVNSSATFEYLIASMFAILSGLIADRFGRKKIALVGFILLGSGYAILGMFPFNIYAWYLHMFIDGITWGIFSVIFWFTIWGDLANEKSGEVYYVLGLLPYTLSAFLRVAVGPWVAEFFSPYAVFSFVAFLLFLAVIPLMYAPETLPENVVKEWELRRYVEKAKRIREKFT